MDFQTEYDKLTKTIDDTLSTQVSSSLSWNNIPGNYDKVVSSSAGYAWAIGNLDGLYKLYICELPCTGNWKPVVLKDYPYEKNIVRDVVVDNTNVYVKIYSVVPEGKSKHEILTNVASGKAEWTAIYSSTDSFERIFSTNNFLWIQRREDLSIKKCPKPCTPTNWIIQPNKDNVMITSTTTTEIFGKDIGNKVVKTDENMKTGWHVLKGFKDEQYLNNFIPIGGDSEKTGTYAVSKRGDVFNCQGECDDEEDISPVYTKGFRANDLTYDSESNKLWMTTTSRGEKGNVFTQLDKRDFMTISNEINPLDKQRDEIVKDTTKEYVDQTKTLTTSKQIQTVVDFFQKFFGYSESTRKQNENQSSILSDNIQKSQQQIDKMSTITSKLFILIITLMVTAIIYLLAEPLLGTFVHYVTILTLGVGIFFTVYY